jgi:hypothetical protein
MFMAVQASTAFAAYNGIQAIGLSKWPASDVDALADIYRRVGGDLEIRFLPHEFNPSRPYTNIDRFVRRVLPGFNGRLRVVVYLYFHDYYSVSCFTEPEFQWKAFAGQTAFRQQYLQRVTAMDTWVKQIWPWIVQQGAQNKIVFQVCPYLEDDLGRKRGESVSDYQNLLGAINYRQVNTDRVPVDIGEYRCPDGRWNNQRVGSSRLERHGRFESARGSLQSGDSYSNDGTILSDADFKTAQRTALRLGINSAWWDPAFNGDRSRKPCERSLTPLAGNMKQRIEDILKAR